MMTDATGAEARSAGASGTAPDLAAELAAGQWHLGRIGGLDAVWTDYSGRGVKVGIYDTGVQYSHWDLAANYDASQHITIDGKTYDGGYRPASGGRGTALAGLIAAANDGAGTVGVAFGSTITGVNILDPYSGEGLDPGISVNAPGAALFVEALRHRVKFDVVVDGWGRSLPNYLSASSRGVDGTDASRFAAAFEFAAVEGRGGLGTISLNGSGNISVDMQANSAFTSRHSITVAAYREDGYATSVGGRGPGLLVSAPSGDRADSGAPGLTTTDLLGRFGNNLRADPGGDRDHSDAVTGTAAAAATVSGVVALMLEANPGLGWRDVADILASSATLPIDWNDRTRYVALDIPDGVDPDSVPNRVEVSESFFTVSGRANANWNGGGHHYSTDYGYGAVDARAVVRMAEVASLFGVAKTSADEVVVSTPTMALDLVVPNSDYDQLLYGQDFVGEPAEYRFEIDESIDVEHVDLTLSYTFSFFGNDQSMWTTRIKLIAPDGTSAFVDTDGTATAAADGEQSFTFGLANFRGAETKGSWTIQFENVSPAEVRIGTAKLDLFGGAVTTDDVHVYTDEFATMVRVDPEGGRRLLVDINGGNDWINAAAVTSDISLSLFAGTRTSFGGVGAFTITRASAIENAVTGDGDDLLVGNALDNILYGMRGDDTLVGGAGDDILAGGRGADLFRFYAGSGHDRILDWEDGDILETYAAIVGVGEDGRVQAGADGLLSFGGSTVRLVGQAGAVLTALGEAGGFHRYGWVSGNAVDHDPVMKIAPAPAPAGVPTAGPVPADTDAPRDDRPATAGAGEDLRRTMMGIEPGGTGVDSLGRTVDMSKATPAPRYTSWGPETLAMAGIVAAAAAAPATISDPFAAEQWHLRKLGDMDRVWSEFTGKGVKVGVYDSGVQYAHPDLASNYDASLHVRIGDTVYDGDFRPLSGPHGTSVAGLIGAARNGIGTVGVAYDATLTGVNIFDPYSGGGLNAGIFINRADNSRFFEAMRQAAKFDVVNHSWGVSQPFYATSQSRTVEGTFANGIADTLAHAAAFGRDGLGTISVMAAGNLPSDSQADSVQTDRHNISVAAYREVDGLASNYSSRGAELFISAPSDDLALIGGTGVVATDLIWREGYNLAGAPGGDYDHTDQFGGTSAATPIVSGVVALMLDANSGLGWRDVKAVLAASAKLPIEWDDRTRLLEYTDQDGVGYATMNESWFKVAGRSGANWNGGGHHFSTDYGFGAVDAFAAVRMAEVWSLFGASRTSANEGHFATAAMPVGIRTTALQDLSREMMHTDFVSTPSSFSFDLAGVDLSLEHVDLTLTYKGYVSFFDEDPFPAGFSGPNRLKLIGPDGTEAFVDATLVVAGGEDGSPDSQSFTFGFTNFRGADPNGTWTIQFESKGYGFLDIETAKLDLYGAAATVDDLYTYTDEYFTMASITGEEGRQVLTDSDGGTDWINAAAVTADVHLSLVDGATTLFDGRDAFTIAAGSRIEHAVTGDGDDRLIGNALDNRLYGMRGDDWLNGGVGNDTLFGGAGNDVFAFDTAGVSGRDTILDWSAGDRIATSKMLRGADQSGLVTVGSNALVLLDGNARGDTAELWGQGGAVLQALGKSDGYWWYGFVSDGDADFVDGRVIELAPGQAGRPAGTTGHAAAATTHAGADFAVQDAAFYLYDTMGSAMATGVQTYA